jgi:hypothetical protein
VREKQGSRVIGTENEKEVRRKGGREGGRNAEQIEKLQKRK